MIGLLDSWYGVLILVTLWCSGYHYCTTPFSKASTQVLHRFISCSWCVGDSRWWGSLTLVPTGNRAKRFSSVNKTTKTIHHHRSNLEELLIQWLRRKKGLKWVANRKIYLLGVLERNEYQMLAWRYYISMILVNDWCSK